MVESLVLGDSVEVRELAPLPTPLEQVLRRARRDADDPVSAWLAWQLAGECATKYTVTVLLAALRSKSPDAAHRIVRELIKAESAGAWHRAASFAIHELRRTYVDREILHFMGGLEKRFKPGSDFQPFIVAVDQLLKSLDSDEWPRVPSWLGVISFLAFLRNKTKGHGAPTREWYSETLDDLSLLIDGLISYIGESGLFFAIDRSGSNRRVLLAGDGSTFVSLRDDDTTTATPAVLVHISELQGAGPDLGDLNPLGIATTTCYFDVSADRYYFLNGSFRASDQTCEYLEYFSGGTERFEIPEDVLVVTGLPRSRTAGSRKLNWFAPTPNNLPQSSELWVERPYLETILEEALTRPQHPVVTLHGVGGSGKTSLALHVAHKLVREGKDRFDFVLWLSARDLDLLPDGLRPTARDIADLSDIAETFVNQLGEFVDVEDPAPGADNGQGERSDTHIAAERLIATLARELESPTWRYLIIIDNFETLNSPAQVHEFFGNHTLAPTKVLITSRVRAAAGDYPIEVSGLEPHEARELMVREARSRYAEGMVDEPLQARLYQVTSGLPYPIKLAIAQIAAGDHPNTVIDYVQREPRILEALFRRSFEALSKEGRYLCLLVGNAGSKVPELLIRLAMARRGMSFEDAERSATRQALVQRESLPSGSFVYSVPHVGAEFLKNEARIIELADQLAEDIRFIKEFRLGIEGEEEEEKYGQRVAKEIVARLDTGSELPPAQREELASILEDLAKLQPDIWSFVAKVRLDAGEGKEAAVGALRRGLQADPGRVKLWEHWIDLELKEKSFEGVERLFGQALDSCLEDRSAVLSLSQKLLLLLSSESYKRNTWDAARDRRETLAKRGAKALENHRQSLNADELGFLGWLHIHARQPHDALNAVQQGLKSDPSNPHLQNLLKQMRHHHPEMFRG